MDALFRSDRDAAEKHQLVWLLLPADRLTPVQATGRLRAVGHTLCLLESVDGPTSLVEYSFIGLEPEASLRSVRDGDGTRCVLRRAEQRVGEAQPAPAGTSLENLRALAHELRLPAPPPGLPPFRGGLVGYLGYEAACELEPSIPRPEADPLGAPSVAFEAFASVCAFDHRAQTIVVSTSCRAGRAGYAAAMARLDALADVLARAPGGEGLSGRLRVQGMHPTSTRDHFCQSVERLQREIRAGEIFQAVPSRKLLGQYEGDLFALYRALRVANGAPHMFFFETEEVSILGSSPERLVEVRGRRCSSVPIAGTRPRGADARQDRELEAELLASRKERSEHDMLVDLARNDLGRVARIGSVELAQHARVVRFRRVQHLVSRVEAELRADRDALDALAACFPAGTVSGAPKVRAMQLLAELEGECRGPYAGAFGYLDRAGDLDTAICIRTFAAAGTQLTLQAGAGVVLDSDPLAECREVDAKLAGPLAALELLAHEPRSKRDARPGEREPGEREPVEQEPGAGMEVLS